MSEQAAPPNVIAELRRSYDELTQSQKRIAEAIVEDPEFVAFATVDKMAARLGVSPSTVVRFAYRLGLDGYQELQDRVRQLVRSQIRANAAPVEGDRAQTAHLGETIYARSFEHDLENLRRSILNITIEDLERAVTILTDARRIFVLGGQTSHSVASYSSLVLDRMRGDVTLLSADASVAPQLLSLTEDDALLVFTFPPYASHTVRVTRHAKRQGAAVIAVTDTPISPVGQLVDVVLPVLASGVSAQNSFVSAMAVANALLNGVVARSSTALDRYRRIVGLMDEWDVFVLKGTDAS
ncbi:MAG: MurR/RpiR family transcriptional regulator [Chloroflexi bacterium]|nr:MurR/RpiR family transcriptional regulator [Chloroflexota bacterium]